MPNIPEYTATAEITPSDKGIQAAELAGRRIGLYGHELADDAKEIGNDIEQHQSLVEISHVAKNLSNGEANLDQLWSQMTTDPNLKNRPDLSSSFMKEKVEPFIEQMQGLATTKAGKEYALQRGDELRQRFMRLTIGDQASIIANTTHENAEQVGNNAAVSAARDPSPFNYQAQLDQVKSTADTFYANLRPTPGEASGALEWHQNYIERHSRDVVIAHYQSMAASVEQDVAKTGDPSKSAVYTDALKSYKEDLKGQDWVKGEEWAELGKRLDDAAHTGQDRFKVQQNYDKSQLSEEGKAEFGKLHHAITERILAGLPPTPEQNAAIGAYTDKYSSSNPGEVATLDDFLTKGADRAQEGKVESYNQTTRDQIRDNIGLPPGDPRRPTPQSLLRDYSHGLITKEDLASFSEDLDRLKPGGDPAFKVAYQSLESWQKMYVSEIGDPKSVTNFTAARDRALHDTRATFMSLINKGADPHSALDATVNMYEKGGGGVWKKLYSRYAVSSRNLPPTVTEEGQVPVDRSAPLGSVHNPIVPTTNTPPPPAHAPASADEVKKADQMIFGKPM